MQQHFAYILYSPDWIDRSGRVKVQSFVSKALNWLLGFDSSTSDNDTQSSLRIWEITPAFSAVLDIPRESFFAKDEERNHYLAVNKKNNTIINKYRINILLSSSLTSMAEILVRQGLLRVPGLLTMLEATLFPFSSGTSVVEVKFKGIPWINFNN